jgi:hypothetical protein
MNPIKTTTFANPDREWAAMLIREHLAKLLATDPKDYTAIKLIYGIILQEEDQDISRRKVELTERQDERAAAREAKPAGATLVPAAEIKRRVRIALGKENP